MQIVKVVYFEGTPKKWNEKKKKIEITTLQHLKESLVLFSCQKPTLCGFRLRKKAEKIYC